MTAETPVTFACDNFLDLSLSHVVNVIESDHYDILFVSNLVEMAIAIKVDNRYTICREPNYYERNL